MRISPAVLVCSVFVVGSAYALDGREIMAKHEEARKTPQFVAQATLRSERAGAEAKEKKFAIWTKLKADGVHFNTLTRFSSPAEVKNEAILFLENDRGENDILLYLPAYQKVRRVERSQQSSSFMGSDFSYSDITTPHVDDYKYTLLGETACPGAPDAGGCYRIEGIPATPAIRERTGYSKILSWVRKDNFMIVRNENFGLEEKPAKNSVLTEIKKLPNGKWLAHRIEVVSASGGKTTLEFKDVKTETKIDDKIFTQQSLAKGGR
jgi:outer membrane lipoprotein-sorting protein